MLFFHSKQKKQINYKLIYFVFPIALLIILFAIFEYTKKPKLLWTPEDVVTLPDLNLKDISSDGKYTLMKVTHKILKDNTLTPLAQCIVVNNKNLTNEIIGTLEQGCDQPQFIGRGDKFSYLLNEKDGKSLLFIKDIVTGKTVKVQELDEDVVNYAFAPDGKSFVYMETKSSNNQSPRIIEGEEDIPMTTLYLQKLDHNLKIVGRPQRLIPPPLTMYNPNLMSYAWSPDSSEIVFTTSKPIWKSSESMTLHTVNIKKNEIKTIMEGNSYSDFSFSPDGQKLAFMKYPTLGNQGMKIETLREISPSVIQIINLKTEKSISIPATDVWLIAGWAGNNDKLIVLKQEGTRRPIFSIDINTKKFTRMNIPQTNCLSEVTLSKNQKYIGFKGETFSHPEEIYVADLEHFAPKEISSINKEVDLSKIQAHSLKWKSFDGLEIEGILIYPQGYKKGQKAPLIVSIHGGPQGVNSEEFIGSLWFGWYSPAVAASLGFATLVVNYRGSLGYGLKFMKLNYQELGSSDFKDIMAGVDYLIGQGIVDPEKLFMEGHSYGGFMGAWAVGHTNRFKAISISAGIVNWITDVATTDYSTSTESMLGGHYWDNYGLWEKVSPLSYVKHVQTPTLILQGYRDARVPHIQALQFYKALRARKIPTRFVSYLDEEHAYGNSFTIIDAMNEIMDWFKKYSQ